MFCRCKLQILLLGNFQKYKIPIRYREYIQEIRTSNRMTKVLKVFF
ncbi:hypothetical protein LEP1GSC041_0874 [Leptospira noguchii str. 2006001870]|nr:hypothetical protein LEP1GSC041_0874 [Leptospira noguchii str. 2006001870]